jgi:hypothetical protein
MAESASGLQRHDLVQNVYEHSSDWQEARSVADQLFAYLSDPEVAELLGEANQPGQPSQAVQAILLEKAIKLEFRSEAKGLFTNYPNRRLRPDYFRPVGDTGIILEVERGQTTTNNNDMLDFWKCHICSEASYLFLLVPNELRHNLEMNPKHEYKKVTKRLEAFFRPENYTNVRGLIVFGY